MHTFMHEWDITVFPYVILVGYTLRTAFRENESVYVSVCIVVICFSLLS